MTRRKALHTLADRLGILPAYVDYRGTTRRTSDATREGLVAAMGFDASSDAAAKRALAALEHEEAERLLRPVNVLPHGLHRVPRVVVRVPGQPRGRLRWELDVTSESGERVTTTGERRVRHGQATLALVLPGTMRPGYYSLRVAVTAGGRRREGVQQLVMAPPSCLQVAERIGRKPAYGIAAQLYAVRSERNWGVGDCGDLRDLVAWARRVGAAFVGVNPLHALRNRGWDVSPYAPVSRLFRNALYLDVSAVPELSQSSEARAAIESAAFRAALERARRSDRVWYEEVYRLKQRALEALFVEFCARHRGRATARGRAYARYLHDQDRPLVDFATFLTLEERLGADWRSWPSRYRDPTSDAVRQFRQAHQERVEFHQFVQFELDRQLAAAGEGAADRLGLGLMGDLAVGTSPSGSDVWAFPERFAAHARIGAPPDDYAAAGQDWGLVPLDPHALMSGGLGLWRLLVRSALKHMQALRIDHVMGLSRQYWIPDGGSPSEGAFVRYPAHALLGVLALESVRSGAIIVGEDLGTVPRELPGVLARWGILSTRVLYFERTARGAFRAARTYSPRALVSATTHDHAPVAGFWEGRDLTLRRAVEALPSDEALTAARAERERARHLLLRRLTVEGVAPKNAADTSAVTAAVHAFLARTPSPLFAVTLDDLVGERDPVNLPGVGPDRYPAWRRRLRLGLDEIASDPGVRRLLGALEARKRGRAHGRPT